MSFVYETIMSWPPIGYPLIGVASIHCLWGDIWRLYAPVTEYLRAHWLKRDHFAQWAEFLLAMVAEINRLLVVGGRGWARWVVNHSWKNFGFRRGLALKLRWTRPHVFLFPLSLRTSLSAFAPTRTSSASPIHWHLVCTKCTVHTGCLYGGRGRHFGPFSMTWGICIDGTCG